MLEIYMIYFIIFATSLIVFFFVFAKNILYASILSSCFSLFTVMMYLILDAPDVAMTEAAVSVVTSIFSIYTIKAAHQTPYNFEDKFKPILFIFCISLACILIYASNDLPPFGSQFAIAQQSAAAYYLKNTSADIGIPSIVAAILASYRGYDTLMETVVILVGGLSVLLVSNCSVIPGKLSKAAQLGISGAEASPPKMTPCSKPDQLITKLTRFMIPVIILFALYLQSHGEISPGGGFQAGVIIATSFILYALAFGELRLLQLFSLTKLQFIAVSGVCLYIATGLIGILSNTGFLNYNILASNEILAQKIGIITVELGVGITVSATMLLIYFCLALNDDAID